MSKMARISRRECLRLSAGAAAGLALSGSVVPIVTKAPEIKTLPLHFQPGDVAFAPQAVALKKGWFEAASFDVEPNAVQISRVYMRRTGDTAADQTLRAADDHDLVVEWTAGPIANRALGAVGSVSVEVITRIVNTNVLVGGANPLTNSAAIATTETDGENRVGTFEFPIKIPGAIGHLVPGNTYKTCARIFAGPRISFTECLFSCTGP